MNRWIPVLVVLVLIATACSSPESNRSTPVSSSVQPSPTTVTEKPSALLTVHEFYHARANGRDQIARTLLDDELRQSLKDANLALNVGQAEGTSGYSIKALDGGRYEVQVRAVLVDSFSRHVKAYSYAETLTVQCTEKRCSITEFNRAKDIRDVVEGRLSQ